MTTIRDVISYRVFCVRSTDEGYPDFTTILSESSWFDTLEDAVNQAVDLVKECHRDQEWVDSLNDEKISYIKDELRKTLRFPMAPEDSAPWQIVILAYYP
jgi:hypothetical protein